MCGPFKNICRKPFKQLKQKLKKKFNSYLNKFNSQKNQKMWNMNICKENTLYFNIWYVVLFMIRCLVFFSKQMRTNSTEHHDPSFVVSKYLTAFVLQQCINKTLQSGSLAIRVLDLAMETTQVKSPSLCNSEILQPKSFRIKKKKKSVFLHTNQSPHLSTMTISSLFRLKTYIKSLRKYNISTNVLNNSVLGLVLQIAKQQKQDQISIMV